MLSLLLVGFLLGMRHALEADHVAAVASLATKNTSLQSAVKQGAAWGLGHTLTLFLFGSIVILTDSIMPEKLALALELAVGVMLVVLGFDVIRRMLRDKVHFHAHTHGNRLQHFHAHKHSGKFQHFQLRQQAGKLPHSMSLHSHTHVKPFPLRALFVGLMHGMAGSAALILLTLQTVSSPWMGLLYILLFGIGSIIGMAALSAIIAVPLMHSPKGLTWLHNGLQGLIGLATVALGSSVIYQIGGNFI